MTNLHELARPFPSRYVHGNPSGGGHYVKHHVINQRLLNVIGPFDFELVQIVRGHVAGRPPNPNGQSARAKAGTPDLNDAVVGAVCRLSCTIDGKPVRVEEVGDCEEPNNWPHDGARLKDAMSDALKRCAMRFGCGLHLWSNDEYFLFTKLGESESTETAKAGQEVAATASPDRKEPTKPPETPDSAKKKTSTGAGAPVGQASPAPPQERMLPSKNRELFALLRDAGISDDDRHRWAEEQLGRPVPSFTVLSKADGQKLIDALRVSV